MQKEAQSNGGAKGSVIGTAPAGYREGNWQAWGDDAFIRIDLRRGWDCRVSCQHVPPRPNEGGLNHGQAGDEWRLNCRRGNVAILFRLFSYARDGKRFDVPGLKEEPLLMPAWVIIHDGRDEAEGERQPCHLVPKGQCVPETLSAFAGDELWAAEFTKAIEPFVLQPIDKIDLDAATRALKAFWPRLVTMLVAHETRPV